MFHRRRNVALITDAKKSPLEDWHHRRREYAILQGSRIPFLLLAAISYMFLHNVVLAAIFTVISVPLPWIAVVVANAVGETQDPRAPRVYKPAENRSAYIAMHGELSGEQAKALMAANPQRSEEAGSNTPGGNYTRSAAPTGSTTDSSDSHEAGGPDSSGNSGNGGSKNPSSKPIIIEHQEDEEYGGH